MVTDDPKIMPLTWDDIVEHCSRLHTTRCKPEGPWEGAEMREASEMLDVVLDGRPVTVVPTRMHEPGFYARWGDVDWKQQGTDALHIDLAELERAVNEGRVTRA